MMLSNLTACPVVHVAVGDDHCQAAIAEALDNLGCAMALGPQTHAEALEPRLGAG